MMQIDDFSISVQSEWLGCFHYTLFLKKVNPFQKFKSSHFQYRKFTCYWDLVSRNLTRYFRVQCFKIKILCWYGSLPRKFFMELLEIIKTIDSAIYPYRLFHLTKTTLYYKQKILLLLTSLVDIYQQNTPTAQYYIRVGKLYCRYLNPPLFHVNNWYQISPLMHRALQICFKLHRWRRDKFIVTYGSEVYE